MSEWWVAARSAAIFGLRVLIVGLMLGAVYGVYWVVSDYLVVRQRANHGQAAYQFIREHPELLLEK